MTGQTRQSACAFIYAAQDRVKLVDKVRFTSFTVIMCFEIRLKHPGCECVERVAEIIYVFRDGKVWKGLYVCSVVVNSLSERSLSLTNVLEVAYCAFQKVDNV